MKNTRLWCVTTAARIERRLFFEEHRRVYITDCFAGDYLDAQRWAQANTRIDAVFMVDPTIYYGWRDFSQRSSFGNLREWLHTGWLYDSRFDVYQEGIKRFGEFGIDIERYKYMTPAISGFDLLSGDIKKSFYLKSTDWFDALSRRYEINYLLMQKKFIQKEIAHESVFENNSFVIYRLTD